MLNQVILQANFRKPHLLFKPSIPKGHGYMDASYRCRFFNPRLPHFLCLENARVLRFWVSCTTTCLRAIWRLSKLGFQLHFLVLRTVQSSIVKFVFSNQSNCALPVVRIIHYNYVILNMSSLLKFSTLTSTVCVVSW